MNIKIVSGVENTLSECNSFKLNLKPSISNKEVPKIDIKKSILKVSDRVKHSEEDIIGTIKFIGDSGISVIWDDNSRERFNKDTNQLVLLDNESLPKPIEKAIGVLEEDIEIDKKESIDIEKVSLERKYNQLENNKLNKLNDKVKTHATNEIIDLAISKGFIDEDDRDIEYQKIICMSDEEYDTYKNEILAFENDHEISSTTSVEEPLTEAEKMLKHIKGGGGIIGDFSKDIPTTSSSFGGGSEKRALSDIDNQKFWLNNQYKVDSFEDQFANILSSKLQKSEPKQVTASHQPKYELPGFENLQGLTKPIQITKDTGSSSSMNFNKLFSDLNWTTNK